jgi:RNA polymerase sigma-70 factor (ECF subfamily)
LDARTTILLRQWHQGDQGALGALLEEHLGWITNHVRHRLGRVLRAKAETLDYVEETILEFLDHGPRFVVANGKHFRALLARIAENVLSGNHRWWTAARRAIDRECPIPRDSVLVLDPMQASPSAAAEDAEREALVRLGLELLRPDQREVIVLRDYQQVALADIAERLGVSAGTAQKRYERAVQALARTVGALRSRRLDDLLREPGAAEE